MLAAFHGHTAVLARLLEAGTAGVNAACSSTSEGQAYEGPTALILAAGCAAGAEASDACVALLLRAGASPHLLCAGRLSALHLSAAGLHAGACARLVGAGAWLQHRDAAGRSALNFAQRTPCLARALVPCQVRGPVLRSLCWLPSVRLLWLGHLAVPGEGLGLLSRDLLRLLCATIVARHWPPGAEAGAEERRAADTKREGGNWSLSMTPEVESTGRLSEEMNHCLLANRFSRVAAS